MKSMSAAVWNTMLTGSLLAMTVAMVAQEAPPPPPPGGPHDVMFMGGPGPMGEFPGDGKTVKGVPLSAVIVTVRDTTLADGNKIHNESQTKIYRDADGRVRREMGVGLATAMAGPVKHNLVMISDPVTGTRYMLNPDNKTARQTPMRGPRGDGGPDHAARMKGMDSANVTKEQLSTKTINGIQAEGVRVTRTIAAGEMGNEKAITVVTERWYSPELQLVVQTTHSDPMMGTVTTKLVTVTPGAPDATLFQVPADYTLQSGKAGDPMFMPMPK
jgi:hypothetical protein